jgi:hypothetical protein
MPPIEDGAYHEARRIDPCGDDRTERPGAVKALGPRPLRKLRITVENIGSSDVVDAGVAEDEIIGFLWRNAAAGLADDAAEFALIGGLAVIGCASPDCVRVPKSILPW